MNKDHRSLTQIIASKQQSSDCWLQSQTQTEQNNSNNKSNTTNKKIQKDRRTENARGIERECKKCKEKERIKDSEQNRNATKVHLQMHLGLGARRSKPDDAAITQPVARVAGLMFGFDTFINGQFLAPEAVNVPKVVPLASNYG